MICTRCKLDKPDESFSKDKLSKSGLYIYCKECQSLRAKKWYRSNKKRQLDLAREPRQRFLFGVKNAKVRGLVWNIEEDKFYELIKQKCKYCQKDPVYMTGVGLDRIDNSIGYELSNVVPCCSPCNSGRNNNFSSDEWQVMIDALMKYKNGLPNGI